MQEEGTVRALPPWRVSSQQSGDSSASAAMRWRYLSVRTKLLGEAGMHIEVTNVGFLQFYLIGSVCSICDFGLELQFRWERNVWPVSGFCPFDAQFQEGQGGRDKVDIGTL